MWRIVLVLGLLLVMAPEAEAQSRRWVPWAEIGNPAPAPRYQQQRSGRAALNSRAYRDDDDDDSSPFASSGAMPRSPVQFPPLMEGGARPDIAPRAPQTVAFRSGYGTGAIVIDTAGRSLYYILSSTAAYKYPISVGRDGFTWRGTERVSRVAAWPDWHPPKEMRERDPRLPEKMTGGVNNPLGAKALYLGNSLYRIHGTNDARSIGYAASSGCFRMMNHHVMHLATLAGVGTTVHVLDRLPSNVAVGVQPSEPDAPAQSRKPRRSAALD